MKTLNISLRLTFVLILSAFLISCSSDDNGGLPADTSYANLTLSGDIEGERSGSAFFQQISSGQTEIWDLSFWDSGPQTFEVNFMLIGNENSPVSQPGPGTYPIGFDPLNSNTVFFGIYTDIKDGDLINTDEYDTFNSEGTLTIETSNENRMKGSFEFTAHSRTDMGEVGKTIHVSGSFEAIKAKTHY